MKCAICLRYFPVKLTYGGRMKPPLLCDFCASKNRPNGFAEAIPFWLGLIDYIPVFEKEHRDFRLENIMMNHWDKSLKLAISNQGHYDLLIDLSENEFRSFREWSLILFGCQRVLFTSIFRFDFSLIGDDIAL